MPATRSRAQSRTWTIEPSQNSSVAEMTSSPASSTKRPVNPGACAESRLNCCGNVSAAPGATLATRVSRLPVALALLTVLVGISHPHAMESKDVLIIRAQTDPLLVLITIGGW